jgi:hypothetical protein
MQTLSGALCLEAHQPRRSRTTSRILGYISLHYFGVSYLVLTLFRLSTENMCMLNGKTSFPIPNVLTAYYEDIKGIVYASGCTELAPSPRSSRASSRTKTTSPPLPLPPPPPPPPTPPPSPPPPRRRRPPCLPAGRAHLLRGGASSGPQPCGQGRQGGEGNRGW